MVAFDRMSFITDYKGSTTWADFGTNTNSGGMSIGEAFMMQIFDTVIYALLACYFDHVLPNEHGVAQHPLFFVQPAFWRNLCTKTTEETTSDNVHLEVAKEVIAELNGNPDIESVHADFGHTGIVTQQLCKDFNAGIMKTGSSSEKKLAVDHLSLAIYKNEITAILGHNGAGKTTTIRMLTGQTSPTGGIAYVFGHNIHTIEGLRSVQATLGLATQDNILWPKLTVSEHLKIFGRLKGFSNSEINAQATEILTQLDLWQKLNVRSDQLSGGQKRRLCLALALVGNPQVRNSNRSNRYHQEFL